MARACVTLALALLMAAGGLLCDAAQGPVIAAKKGQTDKAAQGSEASEDTEEGRADAQAQAKRKPVDAAEAAKLLELAEKALNAGKADHAAQQLNSILSSTRLQPRTMARALYLRGVAHQKQNKPAQAIADLTSALWLKGGLSDAERTMALAARSEAYRAAGLLDLADADAKKSGRAAVPEPQPAKRPPQVAAPIEEPASRAPAVTKQAAVEQKSTSESGSGGLSNFFSNLFGGSQPPTPAGKPAQSQASSRPDPYGVSPQSHQSSIGEAWASGTEVSEQRASTRQAASARTAVPLSTAAAREPAPKAHGGAYRVQVAAVRSRKEAQAVAARLKKDQASLLGSREPEVDETVVGNMGTFYRVRIGPFADASEPNALCAKLRGMGLDCLIVAN
jgi:sporulation related protein